ncbi:MAG: hypothetical protein ACXWU5_10220 [Rhodoplanes sp.]|jgi:hypothetical protein
METEDQKFMALEGLHAWANGVLIQVARIEAARDAMREDMAAHTRLTEQIRSFQRERHLFLIAAYKMLEYIDWIESLSFIDKSIFSEVLSYRKDIKDLRDMNEHVVDYFLGGGHRRGDWLHIDETAIADASSTVGSKIGDRLDWSQLAAAVERLIEHLPPNYFPALTEKGLPP